MPGQRKPGSGRKPGSRNKSTLAKEQAIAGMLANAASDGAGGNSAFLGLSQEQIAQMTPRDGTLLLMRWALQQGNPNLFLSCARELFPYMHAKKAPVAERPADAPTVDEIAADDDPEMAEG